MARIDISNEMHLYRFKDGIKLIRPDHLSKQKKIYIGYDTGYTIGSLFELPFNIGLCHAESSIQYVNAAAAGSMGVESVTSLLGKSNNDIYTSASMLEILHNRRKVLTKKYTQITEENLVLKNCGTKLHRLSIRAPWYNDANEVIGLINTSVRIGDQSLANALSYIRNITLMKTPTLQKKIATSCINNVHLTKREREIAYYVARGKTAKLISELLFISKRTVEAHIENLKNKFGVFTKPDLIEKIFDYFIDDIIL